MTTESELQNYDRSQEEEPRFGLVDVIESFTAMRHEWRGQSKESRELLDSLQATVRQVQKIDSTLTEKLAATSDDRVTRKLVNAIVDLDIQLTRAVEAVGLHPDGNRKSSAATQRDERTRDAVQQSFQQLGFFRRWLCRGFFDETIEHLETSQPDSTAEGFRLLLSDLRRAMKEQSIKRIETTHKPFDGELMNAIATVTDEQTPAGHVAEEISPAYLYCGTVLRYAQVRIAQ